LKANQFGSKKSNKGHVYYEYRKNRLDVKQPKKKQKYPILEEGGMMAKGGKSQGYDDREDERLAMKYGKMSGKDFVGSRKTKEHSRRDDARFEERMADGGYMEKGGMIMLKSVGSAYDPKTKMTYAVFSDGKIDYDNGVYLSEVTDEWMESLSSEDKMKLSQAKKYADGGMMAKGGMTEHGLRQGDKIMSGKVIGTTIMVRNDSFNEDARVDLSTGKRTILEYDKKTKKWVEKMAEGGEMAKKGMEMPNGGTIQSKTHKLSK